MAIEEEDIAEHAPQPARIENARNGGVHLEPDNKEAKRNGQRNELGRVPRIFVPSIYHIEKPLRADDKDERRPEWQKWRVGAKYASSSQANQGDNNPARLHRSQQARQQKFTQAGDIFRIRGR